MTADNPLAPLHASRRPAPGRAAEASAGRPDREQAETCRPGQARAPIPPDGRRSHHVLRTGRAAEARYESDELAQEVPVALEYNGISYATLLATPCDLDDLAYGFSYTEGVIRSAQDIYGIEITEQAEGIVVQLTIASACLNQLKVRRRALAGRTGCGLCGIESLSEVRRSLPALPARASRVSPAAISTAIEQLRALQPLHLATGATHAAGWAGENGHIEHVREDVGRHNALDKLIGHLMRRAIDTRQGIAAISSRASFEMVQKAAAAGISAVAAVSAPTTYAVQVAAELNVLLAGFARDGRFTVYAHPEYLSDTGAPN
jgi:FdhD protein